MADVTIARPTGCLAQARGNMCHFSHQYLYMMIFLWGYNGCMRKNRKRYCLFLAALEVDGKSRVQTTCALIDDLPLERV